MRDLSENIDGLTVLGACEPGGGGGGGASSTPAKYLVCPDLCPGEDWPAIDRPGKGHINDIDG